MARTDNDTWDIATSVGATAVMVALARAAETNSANPLIRDEYAEPLVSTPELAELRSRLGQMWSNGDARSDDSAMNFQQMIDYQAVRTHFFDEFFASAAAAGVRQHVILAAGLDSRAYRLDWPNDTVVYEIDMPAVLDKTATLNAAGAVPSTTRREVAIDLRHDWPAALRDAGFDPDAPTAWLAEGLLPFLPGAAQESMYAAIDGLSAPGSRIAVEVFGVDPAAREDVQERWRQARAEREARGDDDTSFDVLDLWYHDDDGPECADWFDAHGWTTHSAETSFEFERLGRPQRVTTDEPAPFLNAFVTAERPRQPVG